MKLKVDMTTLVYTIIRKLNWYDWCKLVNKFEIKGGKKDKFEIKEVEFRYKKSKPNEIPNYKEEKEKKQKSEKR